MNRTYKKSLRRSHLFLPFDQLICPSGTEREFLSSPPRKNISIPFFRILWFYVRVPPPQEGRFAIVTNVRWDAVDAAERETSASGCVR